MGQRDDAPVERDPLVRLDALLREVDRSATRIAAKHGDRLRCRRGCSGCCIDGLSATAIEAERIRAHHATLLAEGAPHPAGGCAFLDDHGACRIYPDRPYICRTQGLPLRWFEGGQQETAPVERRDICPENEAGPELTTLAEDACFTLGPVESKLADLSGEAPRVPLRSLFAVDDGESSDR